MICRRAWSDRPGGDGTSWCACAQSSWWRLSRPCCNPVSVLKINSNLEIPNFVRIFEWVVGQYRDLRSVHKSMRSRHLSDQFVDLVTTIPVDAALGKADYLILLFHRAPGWSQLKGRQECVHLVKVWPDCYQFLWKLLNIFSTFFVLPISNPQ